MRCFILFLIVFVGFEALSQESKTTNSIYSGGMLALQIGDLKTKNEFTAIDEISSGIGGILRFYVWDWVSVGIYGGTQNASYATQLSDKSYVKIGYGGGFIGFSRKYNKLRYTLSWFVGRGSVNNLHINAQINSKLTDAYYFREKMFVLSPIISMDYAITQRISLTIQGVYLFSKVNNSNLQLPIFQAGVLFNR